MIFRLLVLLLTISVAGCAAGPGDKTAPSRTKPITLTYPYGESGYYLFDNYQQIVASAAKYYVDLTIIADPESASGTGQSRANVGSGTIVHPAGYIVTAAHIALNTKYSARITLMDGRVLNGDVVHLDRERDLALIRTTGGGPLPAPVFADSDLLKQGRRAFTVGSPNGVKGVAALGIVLTPKLDRPLAYSGYSIKDGIELGMAVFTGNSGGPVFNQQGELIGMIASYNNPDLRKLKNAPPNIGYAVPSRGIAAYLSEVAGL